jgi:FlaA1/EpsC-like NDP-sugar epimerase
MSPTFRRILLQRAARLFDLAAVTVTFLVAFALSSRAFTWVSFESVLMLRIKVVNIVIFGGYLTLCSAIFSSCGLYLSHRLSRWARDVREIFVATTIVTGVLFVLPLRMEFATAEFFALFWLLTFATLVISRTVGQRILYYARSYGRNVRNLVVVGEGLGAMALTDRIEKETTLGYRVVRVITVEKA